MFMFLSALLGLAKKNMKSEEPPTEASVDPGALRGQTSVYHRASAGEGLPLLYNVDTHGNLRFSVTLRTCYSSCGAHN